MVAFFVLGLPTSVFAQLMVLSPECEYRENPLGLDVLQPRLSWKLSSLNSKKQSAFRILVAGSEEELNADKGDLWDSGKVTSEESNNILYAGKELSAFRKCWWKVKVWDESGLESDWSRPACFSVGPLNRLDWSAEWIGADREADNTNFPFIRKRIEVDRVPQIAIAHINVIGYFELYVNGARISEDILNPAVSDYSKQTLFVSYDIQPYLKEGENIIGIWLAHGWYRHTPDHYYGVTQEGPMLRANIQMDFGPGQRRFIRSDRTWQFLESNREYLGGWQWGNFGGEKVNLAYDIASWSLPGFRENDWRQVDNYKIHQIPVVAQRNKPTRILAEIQPVGMEVIGEREFLYDFGKHMTGWIALNFAGADPDEEIRLEYIDKILETAEIEDEIEQNLSTVLNDGTGQRAYISYNQRDVLLGAGNENETFSNKFNYHAFRWVKISGLDREKIKKITALQISESNEQISTFKCSDPLLNKIWEAVNNTYRCINYNGYVVDCPHRERFGYGGDSHSSMEAGLSNFDLAALFNKWTLDWNAGNYPNGLWPHTVPEKTGHKNAFSPGWGGFGMFMPWQFYIYYGDTSNLLQAYPYIERWMAYMESNVMDGILQKDTLRGGNSDWSFHGDWVAPYYGMQPEDRVDQHSTDLFNNCFYLYELQMAEKIAGVLGKKEDAEHYSRLYARSKPLIHEAFYDASAGYYANGEQPYQALPLLVDLVPEDLKADLDSYLEYLILEKNKGHLNSGMLGTYFLLEYLMKTGRNDLICTMVSKRTFPGWGHMIENGATTIWEQWNGDNSQIHNCYLSVGKWFIQGLGGIQPDREKAGFRHFIIRPGFVDQLDYAGISYKTRFGRIESSWKQDKKSIRHRVLVPVNTVATYRLQPMKYKRVLVNGEKAGSGSTIQLTPGEYEITLVKDLN